MTKKPNKSGDFRRAAAPQPASLSTKAPRAAAATPPEGSGAVGVHFGLPKPKKSGLDPVTAWLRTLPDDRLGVLLRHATAVRVGAQGAYDSIRAEMARRAQRRAGVALLGKRRYDQLLAETQAELDRRARLRGTRPKR